MKICSVSEIRELDRRAIEEFDISEDILMENAGHAVYYVILREIGIRGRRFVVVCGVGNNGGDGLVVARKLYSEGAYVKVFIVGNVEKFRGSAKRNFEIACKLGFPIKVIANSNSLDELVVELANADVIVDAIFGTGLSREVSGIYRDIIRLINESGKVVVSVDIPSGVSGNTGKVMGIAVKANYTVTFGLPKIGNILYPGFEYCGKLYVSHISYPPQIQDAEFIKTMINTLVKLPERKRDGHKGTFGKALFIAGAVGYYGAPYFSAMSFLKAGGGYSRLATPRSVVPFIASKGSEIVFIPLNETETGSIALSNKDRLLELIGISDIVVMGPGVSLNEETQELIRQLALEIDKPVLIDGDGITAISKDLSVIEKRKDITILTPHIGEMSRITGLSIQEINEDKLSVLRETARKLNAIIVLKGAHSLIGYPDGRVYVNMSGNPGMATAGSGDVLTGTIAALYGLGLNIEDAVRIGVFIHGFAGDLAADDLGEDGVTAQDILDYLPLAMKYYREELDKVCNKYSIPVI